MNILATGSRRTGLAMGSRVPAAFIFLFFQKSNFVIKSPLSKVLEVFEVVIMASAEEYEPPKVNLRGMLRLDDVEDLLANVLNKLHKQEVVIKELQSQLANRLDLNTAGDTFENIFEQTEMLRKRVTAVESASTVFVGEESLPASNMISMHINELQEIRAELALTATKTSVEGHFSEFADRHERDVASLRDQTAPLSMGTRLQQAQQDSAERLVSLERMCALKLDKSDLGHVEALAENLGRFEEFRVSTIEHITRLATTSSEHTNELKEHSGLLRQHSSSLDRLREEVALLAPKTEVRSLARELQSIRAGLESDFITRGVYEESEERINVLTKRQDATDQFDARLAADLEGVHADLSTRATKDEVRVCVLRKHFEQVVTALGEDVERRATLLHVGSIEERTRGLEDRMDVGEERIDVAVRFVDWFTQRGENYEHNMKVIDKHIGNLAQAQTPQARDPYKGQIRFTPVLSQLSSSARQVESDAQQGVAWPAPGVENLDMPQPRVGMSGVRDEEVSALLKEAASLLPKFTGTGAAASRQMGAL